MGKIKMLAKRGIAGFKLRPPVVDVPPRGLVLEDVTVVNPGTDRTPARKLVVDGFTIASISDGISPRLRQVVPFPGVQDFHQAGQIGTTGRRQLNSGPMGSPTAILKNLTNPFHRQTG